MTPEKKEREKKDKEIINNEDKLSARSSSIVSINEPKTEITFIRTSKNVWGNDRQPLNNNNTHTHLWENYESNNSKLEFDRIYRSYRSMWSCMLTIGGERISSIVCYTPIHILHGFVG